MNPSPRSFVLLFILLCTGAWAQTYWDEIELIDGQVLRGVVIDTVKDTKVIQLTTRDFISLPASSVVRTVTAQERRKQAEAKLALPPVKVDLNLAVVTSSSPGWKASWATVRYQASQSLGIELEDGQVFEANWLDTTRGQAALLLADGRILVIDRASIRRVTATPPAPLAAPAALAAPAVQAEPAVIADTASSAQAQPDLLTPFIADIAQSLEAVFAGPPGSDPAPFRTFFVPTARLASPGRLQVHQLDGAATQITFGVTDYFQVQAASALPTLAATEMPSFWQAGAQVSLPLTFGGGGPTSWLSVGQWSGGLRTDKTWSDPTFLPFLNYTIRTEENGSAGFEGTFLAGYMVRSRPQSPQAVVGTSVRLDAAPGLAVMVEFVSSWTLEVKADSRTSAVVGIRLWHGNTALDLGVQGVKQALWEHQWVSTGWWSGYYEKVLKDTTMIYPAVNLSLRF